MLQWKNRPPLPQEYMERLFNMLPYELLHRNIVLAANCSHYMISLLQSDLYVHGFSSRIHQNESYKHPGHHRGIFQYEFSLLYYVFLGLLCPKTLAKRRKSSGGKHNMEMSSSDFLRTAFWQVVNEDVSRAL